VAARDLKILLADAASRLIWHLGVKKREIGSRIAVLCYQRVLPEFVETCAPIWTILPEQFEAHMAFLPQQVSSPCPGRNMPRSPGANPYKEVVTAMTLP
jgi:hypothetical protein